MNIHWYKHIKNVTSFVIPRGYHSSGSVDTAVCNSIVAASNAGIKTRDTYMFPCNYFYALYISIYISIISIYI